MRLAARIDPESQDALHAAGAWTGVILSVLKFGKLGDVMIEMNKAAAFGFGVREGSPQEMDVSVVYTHQTTGSARLSSGTIILLVGTAKAASKMAAALEEDPTLKAELEASAKMLERISVNRRERAVVMRMPVGNAAWNEMLTGN
jgi:hypothetical protein